MKQYLIADSGGTKTDWCLIDSDGDKNFFTTESSHPLNWNDDFFIRLSHSLENIPNIQLTDLYFFGSGCYRDENRLFLEHTLLKIGFNQVKVKSDLHGAGFALYGKEEGWCAIMGTGSVLFKWDGANVLNVIGGKGHKDGDEGSGFYFGNLVYEDYFNSRLTDEQKNVFETFILKNDNLTKLQNVKARAAIASALSSFKGEFEDYHEKNFEAFYKTHLDENNISSLKIVGGYAYHHKSFLIPFLAGKSISTDCIIDKPIANLIEQMGSFID